MIYMADRSSILFQAYLRETCDYKAENQRRQRSMWLINFGKSIFPWRSKFIKYGAGMFSKYVKIRSRANNVNVGGGNDNSWRCQKLSRETLRI